MLMLDRRIDQQIMIGDSIVIQVVDVRGGKVRLGIAAPIEISVHRKEVHDKITEQDRRNGDAHRHRGPRARA